MIESDDQPVDETGVLSSLTGTRPQRRSPKRPAAGPARPAETTDPDASETKAPKTVPPASKRRTPAAPRPPKSRGPAAARPTADPKRTAGPKQTASPPPPPPAQGFEPNPIAGPVDPPTGTEILASVAKGATELAELGLALTRRLAHSLLDRLPRI
ncbi:MAG TPA: hypothetical protein VIJ51_18340 [Solirubrobacteraceae bacterium]